MPPPLKGKQPGKNEPVTPMQIPVPEPVTPVSAPQVDVPAAPTQVTWRPGPNDVLPIDAQTYETTTDYIRTTPVVPTKISGKEKLKGRMAAAQRYVPGMSVAETSRRVRLLADFNKRIEAMPEITEEEADMIMAEYMSEFSTVAVPTRAGVPQDEAALLEQAYGPAPTPRSVEASDYDKNDLYGAAAALASSLLFGGNPQIAQRLVAQTEANAAQRVNLENQQIAAEDAAKRQRVLAMYQRLQGINDSNFQQDGFAADDARESVKTAFRELGIQDRGAEQSDRIAKRNFQADIRRAIMDGDEQRSAVLAKLYQAEFPDSPLPEEIWQLAPTRNQRLLDGKIAGQELQNDLTEQYVQSAKWKNDISKATFSDIVAMSGVRLQITQKGLEKLKIEVEKLPDYLDAKTSSAVTGAKATWLRAQAAMVNAKRPRAGGGAATDNGRLTALGKIISSGNTNIDNLNQQLKQRQSQLEVAQKRLDQWAYLPKDQRTEGEKLRREATVKTLTDSVNNLEQSIRDIGTRMTNVGNQIEQIVNGGGEE
jgi:hypothetical protein